MNSVGLRPLRYQFSSPCRDPYDDNWLIVAGEVTTAKDTWSFAEPCLLTDEAQSISAWLRAVAAGRVRVTGPDSEGELSPALSFMEPCLAFSLADRDEGGAVVRVHLSLEAVPPWQQDEDAAYLYQYTVDVRVDTDALLGAADAWDLGVPDAAHFSVASALWNYILGVGGQNAANARVPQPGTDRTEFLGAVSVAWAGLDPDEYAFTRSVAGQLRDHDDRAEFLAGIDLILAGITARQ